MLSGAVVWAATQTAESSSIENNDAFNFMANPPLLINKRLQGDCRRSCGLWVSGGISRFLKAFPYIELAGWMEKLQVRAAGGPLKCLGLHSTSQLLVGPPGFELEDETKFGT